MHRIARVVTEVGATAMVGFLAIAGPAYADPNRRDYGNVVRNAIEGFKFTSLGLLVMVGGAAGYFGRVPWIVLGLATAGVLPGWAILDMATGGDHNLFPFEFAFYAFYSLFGIAGAWLGRLLPCQPRSGHGDAL
jgi:hypothetical protein